MRIDSKLIFLDDSDNCKLLYLPTFSWVTCSLFGKMLGEMLTGPLLEKTAKSQAEKHDQKLGK